jgi:hypothetical protein
VSVAIPPRRGKPKTWPTKVVANPGTGLNDVISDEYIADSDGSAMQNVRMVEAGSIAKRNGYHAVGSGLNHPPKGMASYYHSGSRDVLTIDDTVLKKLISGVWTAITGASFTAGRHPTFVQARGDLYIHNGSDASAKLSASTLTRPTTTVTGAFGIFYAGRHIVAGTPTQTSRLFISAQADASDFTVATGGTAPQPDNSTDAPGASVFAGTPSVTEANILDVSKDDGDKLTGLAKFQEMLIVFKERSTYSLTFDVNGNPVLKQISSTVGCVSHRSIDNVENDVFFLSRNGYFTLGYQANFNLALRTNELSAKIHPLIETITPANLPNTCSIFHGYIFYSGVSVGGTPTNNLLLTFDKRYQGWAPNVNVNANAFTVFIDDDNVEHLYYASENEPAVYELDTGYSDNGQAIDAYWISKAIGDFSQQQQILYVDLQFRLISGVVRIDILSDTAVPLASGPVGSSGNLTGTMGDEEIGAALWGGDIGALMLNQLPTANVVYRMQVNKATRVMKVKVSNANNNETFNFIGFKYYYRPYAPQKFDARFKIQTSTPVAITVPTGPGSSSLSGQAVGTLMAITYP